MLKDEISTELTESCKYQSVSYWVLLELGAVTSEKLLRRENKGKRKDTEISVSGPSMR